jgi:hypothetical protein
MPRFDRSGFNTNAVYGARTGLDIASLMSSGVMPKHWYGLDYSAGGPAAFAKIAHRNQQLKQIDNMTKNGVSDQLVFSVKDMNGVVTTPFELFGHIYKPDANGEVRIADQGKIDEYVEIKKYQRAIVDDLMDECSEGDEICSYMFGVPLEQWLKFCRPDGDVPKGCNMSKEMRKLDCTFDHIDGLPPCLEQAQCTSKLRKLVSYFAKNVNLDGLTNRLDARKNMKDGHNNPDKLSDTGLFAGEKTKMKKYAEEREEAYEEAYKVTIPSGGAVVI